MKEHIFVSNNGLICQMAERMIKMLTVNERDGYKLRESFWTPYEQYHECIGRKFEVIDEVTDIDKEIKGELFSIKFTDNGATIQAWFEEIYQNSCTVDGKLM